MRSWFNWLVTVAHPSLDTQRRGRNLITILAGFCVTVLFFIPTLLLSPPHIAIPNTIGLVVAELIWICLIYLARRGHVTLSASIFSVQLIAGLIVSGLATQSYSLMYWVVVTLPIVSATLAPRQIWAMLAGVLGSLALVALLLYRQSSGDLIASIGFLVSVAILSTVAGLVSYLGARSTAIALQDAYTAQEEAKRASAALEIANSSLEERVANRTESLQYALAELSASLEQQQHLNSIIQEFSVPIIPVLNGVLIVPLIGNLDAGKINTLNDRILNAIESHKARVIFLDLTGAAIVDTHTAQMILNVAKAAGLLGAKMTMIGIRPDVAQSLVSLGVDLNDIHTAASLHTGLAELLAQREKQLSF